MSMETNIVDMTPKRVPLKIKRATDTAKLPSHGSNDAAGWDLFADITEDVVIPPHENRDISTGLIMEIPTGYWGGVYPRSGIARKENLRPANTPGCIDSDYRGVVLVVLHNDSDYPRTISPGERVAQLILHKVIDIDIQLVEEVSNTERATGGFGSTGKF